MNLKQVCKALRFGGTSLPKGYEASFQRAKWTFRHQRIYKSESRSLSHLRDLPSHGLMAEGVKDSLTESDKGLGFLGPLMENKLARQIAEGLSHTSSLDYLQILTKISCHKYQESKMRSQIKSYITQS